MIIPGLFGRTTTPKYHKTKTPKYHKRMDKEEVIRKLRSKKARWRKKFGITNLILFGSIARDTGRSDSDVDLIYEKDPDRKMTYQEYIDFIREIESTLQCSVDLVFQNEIDPIVEYYSRDNMITI
jgi:predicted nucleotidyltransferase